MVHNRGFLFVSFFTFFTLLFPFRTACPAEAPMTYVTFWFDTEDYILPQADDAAKRIAEIFTARNIHATFKIVGEKARVLEERGRDDVIQALSRHDIGYHTTYHSIHPTPSEYSRDLSWHEGVQEFLRREGIGLEMVESVFQRKNSCYGQPGGSWTPQSYAILREWDIPLYLDATPHVNLNNRPFYYGGILNVLELGDCLLNTSGWDENAVRKFCDQFDQAHRQLAKEGGGLISVYYHPCEFVHQQFWDGVNFAKGANPPRSEWKLPPMKSEKEQEQAFGVLEKILDHILKQPNIRFVTASDIPALYPDDTYSQPLNHKELIAIAEAMQKKISFVDLRTRFLSPAEALFAMAALLAESDENLIADEITVVFTYGPASRTEEYIKDGSFTWEEIVSASIDFLDAIFQTEQMPSVVWIGGKPVRPQDFAATLATVVTKFLRKQIPTEPISLVKGTMEAEQYVANDSDPGLWGWVIFPEGFHAPKLMEMAKLQAWTIKPAKLQK
ncbi:MAG: hypothetical protein C4527_07750 [Candidatus Omnitrophota bacterium]|jgi:peptidoglycan/xylan/chitin deacetylase (PgdA/CDA1 family)|nr:MAG: hypothetical protein C4527_07750 [Candidatus Omnitrophota bacterium]